MLTDDSTASNRFAHVEFASAEEALRAARQGAPYGFRYAERLLAVDFAHWMFYIGPAYLSLGGTHLMGDIRCRNGRTTSLTSSG